MKMADLIKLEDYRTLIEVADAFNDAFCTVTNQLMGMGDKELELMVEAEIYKLTKGGYYDLLDFAKYLSDNLPKTPRQKIYHP